MRLSTRGRYGLRAMYELALHYGEGPIPLNFIADKQMVSVHYLEQLMAKLRRAGLVVSSRGAQGGYELSRPPEKITVGDVVRITEGSFDPVQCLSNDFGDDDCEQFGDCVVRLVWKRLRDSTNEVLDSLNLRDLCDGTIDPEDTLSEKS
ncbi:MAG: Rrf2 family transcriptional regulator [Firmicutes bacterium]|nr:Rrf2 family transcriptional regulator [Bacillota bacterium]